MIRLWVNGAECAVPQDLEVEFHYNTTDADGIEAQCSHYSTEMALPRVPQNIDIFTPLFDIHSILSSASFDIYATVPAIIELAGQTVRGYIKMESIDDSYHIRFINGAGLLLEKLQTMKLTDLPEDLSISIPYRATISSQWGTDYESVYGSGTANEYYVLFPAFADDEPTFDQYLAGVSNGDTAVGRFMTKYVDYTIPSPEEKVIYYDFTEHQANIYRKSHLRCAVQMKYIFQRIMTASGFTADYTTDFFKKSNPYWANLFMVMRQVFDSPAPYAPYSYLPDMNCADFILGYCKLFGLRIEYAGSKIRFLTREEWYDIYNSVDISDRVDRKTGIAVKPNPYHSEIYAAFLDCAGTPTGVNADKDGAINLYDGIPFKYCEMMNYAGPGVDVGQWTHYQSGTTDLWEITDIRDQDFELPYIPDTEGGELVFREWGGNNRGCFVTEDTIISPSTNLVTASSLVPSGVKMLGTPRIVTSMTGYPLYAYKDSIRYNYSYSKRLATAENGYAKFFADYITEIQSKDNAYLVLEGWFTPAQLSKIATCKTMVMVDGVRCRVIECVTNYHDKCKLTLQKISDRTNLIKGQLFVDYFLNVGRLAVPDSASLNDTFPLPAETNDVITYVTQNYFSWNSATPYTLTYASPGIAATTTFAGKTGVVVPSWQTLNIKTQSGLDKNARFVFYHAGTEARYDKFVSYGYNPGADFLQGGDQAVLRPFMIAGYYDTNLQEQAVLQLRDYSGNLWTNRAWMKATLSQTGKLTFEAVGSAALGQITVVYVTLESPDGSAIYARSEQIGLAFDGQ